jgi:hypothetical protein
MSQLTHLVHIPQVPKLALGVDDGKVDVQVSVVLLGFDDQVDNMIHSLLVSCCLRRVFGVFGGKEVADGFDPEEFQISVEVVKLIGRVKSETPWRRRSSGT